MKYLNGINEAYKKRIKNNIDDIIKSWKEFEDEQGWEFDYFWNKIEKYTQDYDRYYEDIRSINNNPDIDYHVYLYSSGNDDIELRKRNAIISVETAIDGCSGGSCYGDEAEYYQTGNTLYCSDLIELLRCVMNYIFGKNNQNFDIEEILSKLSNSNLIHEDYRTDYGYYGNYDNYSMYYIKLWDLYTFLAKNYVF